MPGAPWLEATEDELVALVSGVAEGRIGKADVAVFIQVRTADAADA